MNKFRKAFLSGKEKENLTILDLGSQYIDGSNNWHDTMMVAQKPVSTLESSPTETHPAQSEIDRQMQTNDEKIRPDAPINTHSPLVSVIIPVYNGERFIAECLDSVLAQTYPNLEILLCDDASTDGTYEIVKRYQDSRIRWLPNPENLGQVKNLNRGIEQARGEYICWLNQDDLFLPEKVEQQLAEFERQPELGAVFCRRRDVDLNLNPIEVPGVHNTAVFRRRDEAIRQLIFAGCFLTAPSVMIRRNVLSSVGLFNESYEISFDFDMWFRILQKYPIANLEQKLVMYRNHSGNASQNPENFQKIDYEGFRIYREAFRRFDVWDLLPENPPEELCRGERAELEARKWAELGYFFSNNFHGHVLVKEQIARACLERAERDYRRLISLNSRAPLWSA